MHNISTFLSSYDSLGLIPVFLVLLGQFWFSYDCFGLSRSVLVYLGHFYYQARTVLTYLGQFWFILDVLVYIGLFLKKRGCLYRF